MNEAIAIIANIVTILGFPLSVGLVVWELSKNNKSILKNNELISKLTDSINQQNIKADIIKDIHISSKI